MSLNGVNSTGDEASHASERQQDAHVIKDDGTNANDLAYRQGTSNPEKHSNNRPLSTKETNSSQQSNRDEKADTRFTNGSLDSETTTGEIDEQEEVVEVLADPLQDPDPVPQPPEKPINLRTLMVKCCNTVFA